MKPLYAILLAAVIFSSCDGDDVDDVDVESSSASEDSINGGWIIDDGEGKRNILTFINSSDWSHYVIFHEYDDGDTQGAGTGEYGTYTWNAQTGDFSVEATVESDGSGGFYSDGASSISNVILNGDVLEITSDDGVGTAQRLPNDPDGIVGSWVLGDNNENILTILSATEYVIAHTEMELNTPPVSGEFGEISISGDSISFLATTVNSDEDAGIDGGSGPFSLNGDQLTIEIDPGDEPTFHRISI